MTTLEWLLWAGAAICLIGSGGVLGLLAGIWAAGGFR